MKPATETDMLTPNDLRHARNVDLANLTGFDSGAIAAWSSTREISGKNLSAMAKALGMEKHEVLQGIELRKQDTAIARDVQRKLEQFIVNRNTLIA